MIYIQPFAQYDFRLSDSKLESLSRLLRLGLPTISNAFLVLPHLFWEFAGQMRLPESAVRELHAVFKTIMKMGRTVTLTASVFEPNNPPLAYSIRNGLDIKDFSVFLRMIIRGYKKLVRTAVHPDHAEACFLIHGYYNPRTVGTVHTATSQGQIYITAGYGTNPVFLSREDSATDEYLIEKRTFSIVYRNVPQKRFRFYASPAGIRKVRVVKALQSHGALRDEQVIELARYSAVAEKAFGPQRMEFAVENLDRLIFLHTYDL